MFEVGGRLPQWVGIVFLLLLALYLWRSIAWSRDTPAEEIEGVGTRFNDELSDALAKSKEGASDELPLDERIEAMLDRRRDLRRRTRRSDGRSSSASLTGS